MEDEKLSAYQPQSNLVHFCMLILLIHRPPTAKSTAHKKGDKAMMHVVGDQAWQWSPIGSFSWKAFKDDLGQNNLVEWCEWGIAVLFRIEHSPGPLTWEFSLNSFLLHLNTLDPEPWSSTLKETDMGGKGFFKASMRYTAIPFALTVNLLA